LRTPSLPQLDGEIGIEPADPVVKTALRYEFFPQRRSCENRPVPKPLWAPWRLEYVTQADELPGCPLCAEAAGEVEESLVVHRGETVYALLNKYPYSSGHLIVAPYSHVGELELLQDAAVLEIHRVGIDALAALRSLYRPAGFNLGWNIGRAAGAGIPEHVHLHIVPRWAGDTSFMPVLGDVKVVPEHLLATRDRLRAAWPGRSKPRACSR
jgi:ATP adenylyltransferase